VWRAVPVPTKPWESIGYALGHASQGDTVQLEAGIYELSEPVHLTGVRLIGIGAQSARIRFSKNANTTSIDIKGAVVIEGVSIESQTQLIYIRSQSAVDLRNVAIAGGDGHVVAIGLERDSTLVAEGIDASQFNTYYLCYSLAQGTGGVPRVYSHNVTGVRAEGHLVYGPADLFDLDKGVSLP
jgi:hypothetical protein